MTSPLPSSRTRDDVLPASYQQCFGCGDANDAGINLKDLRLKGGVARATLRPHSHHQGFPGVLHGGIATAALDEVMSYACVLTSGTWCATAKMELRFRKPVPLDQDLFVEGGLDDPTATRRFHTWAKLTDASGAVYVEAKALFLPASGAMLAGLQDGDR